MATYDDTTRREFARRGAWGLVGTAGILGTGLGYALREDNACGGRHSSRDPSWKEVQALIDCARRQGRRVARVPEELLPYDASKVQFEPGVQLVRKATGGRSYDPLAYGAVGDAGRGDSDDSDSLQALFDSVEEGSTIEIKEEHVISRRLTLNQASVRVVGGGRLHMKGNGNYDQMILIAAPDVRWGVSIDQRQVDPHSGRGEGIRLASPRCQVDVDRCFGERPVRSDAVHSNLVFVGSKASDCKVDGVFEQAAYAAIRQNGAKRLHVGRVRAIDYGYKGYAYNSPMGADGSLVVDDFYSRTDSSGPGVSGFLLDPDDGDRAVESVHIRSMSVEGNMSQGAKIQYVKRLTIDRLHLNVPRANVRSLTLTDVQDSVVIDELRVHAPRRVVLDTEADTQIRRLEIRGECGAQDNLDIRGPGRVVVDHALLAGARDGSIRWTGQGRVVIRSLVQDGCSDGTVAIRAIRGIEPGQVSVVDWERIVGSDTLTGSVREDANIQRNEGRPREFVGDRPPGKSDEAGWQATDRMWNSSPSSDGPRGWLHVAEGTERKWIPIA